MGAGGLLERVGGWGRFHVLQVSLMAVPLLFVGSHNFLQNFSAAVPPHRCRGSGHPRPEDPPEGPEGCVRLPANGTNATEACTEGWVFDQSVFAATIATEWELVCGQRSLRGMAQSIYMTGTLLGSVGFGGLADRLGRRVVFLWSLLQVVGFSTGAALAPSFPWYCVCRFLCGMGISGLLINGIGLTLEWTPPRRRAPVVAVLSCWVTMGQVTLAGLAFCFRHWRHLQLVVGLPCGLSLLCSWWLPESARWLLAKGRPHEAQRSLRLVARVNGVPGAGEGLSLEMPEAEQPQEPGTTEGASVLDLFRRPAMRTVTTCITAIWFSSSLAFYALALDVQRFPGEDPFVVQLVLGAADLPFRLLVVGPANRLGRRITQASCLLLGGGLGLLGLLVPRELGWLNMVLTVLGKGLMSASLTCAYLFASELFPTPLRQTGVGIISMVARLGAVLAPLLLLAGPWVPRLPPVLFSTVALASGLLVAFLPETAGLPLPDTLEQAQSRVQTHSFWRVFPWSRGGGGGEGTWQTKL
ncbi:solute carrier family 22 member 6-B-like [Tachyglossus aculeatus]|uniref:solute carrier family 22 member 6-B-like n=1 Tax=Tachyglossus aculeatus TaxID=9261 RepID=UPI0018F287E8|nr:solute carrier family 22 member 6-B-like [Tachyglossus aculeatus]